MGIASGPRPQPPGECSNPAHGPRILVDTAKPFIGVARLVATRDRTGSPFQERRPDTVPQTTKVPSSAMTDATVNVVVLACAVLSADGSPHGGYGPYWRGRSRDRREDDNGEDAGRLPGPPRIEDRAERERLQSELDEKVAQRRAKEDAEAHAGTLPWYRRIFRGSYPACVRPGPGCGGAEGPWWCSRAPLSVPMKYPVAP